MTESCPICVQSARRESFHPDGWIWRCPNCSHAFTDPHSSSLEKYDESYFLQTHRNWFQHPNTALFRRIRNLIHQEKTQEGVLDVGCGRGDLLFFLEADRPELSLAGIDLAPLPPHPPIDFVSQDLFSWDPKRTFDVVTSLAVIEHVQDIRKFLAKLRQFTKNGGRIVLMTLNEDGLVYATARALRKVGFAGPFERLYSKHHRHHFTRRSLRHLVEQSGLKVLEHFTHNFPLAAVDFPSRGPWLDSGQKAGVAALFGLGRIYGRGFLQTLVCRSSV